MSTPNLSPTSHLVLGLVAGAGPITPYEMKQFVAASIGYFWTFPHSQLYAEPDRLVDAGLLAVEQEEGGRRRKRYSITEAGRGALVDWLSDPSAEDAEIREPATLKLFFGALTDREAVTTLARAQADHHRTRLAEYEAIEAAIRDAPDFAFPLATLRYGMKTTQASIEFWDEVAAHPPNPRES